MTVKIDNHTDEEYKENIAKLREEKNQCIKKWKEEDEERKKKWEKEYEERKKIQEQWKKEEEEYKILRTKKNAYLKSVPKKKAMSGMGFRFYDNRYALETISE